MSNTIRRHCPHNAEVSHILARGSQRTSPTSQMFEATSRIETDIPIPSPSDPHSHKESRNLWDRWNRIIPTHLSSECFWKHSSTVIKQNNASNCIQRRIKLQVDPLRLTGRYLRSAHAASHTTKQYWNYLCLIQTPSHSPVSPLKAQWKSGRTNAKLHPQGFKLPHPLSTWHSFLSLYPLKFISSMNFAILSKSNVWNTSYLPRGFDIPITWPKNEV